MFCIKSQQNRTTNENLTVWGSRAEGAKEPPLSIQKWLISIIIGKRMQMFCFKFQENHTVNEEFDFFEGVGEGPPEGKGAPNHKFLL